LDGKKFQTNASLQIEPKSFKRIMQNIFITGIGTDVGKTVVSSIVVQALEADYWKPIQAGDLDTGDAHSIQKLIDNQKTIVHPNIYALKTPASPHFAASLDGITIDLNKILRPKTTNTLVIEGAGGILVPLNDTETILDLILPEDKIIVVSRHYLGSINHTLLTIEILKQKGLNILGIVFNGNENKATESIILQKTGLTMIGRMEDEPYLDKSVISYYADIFRPVLKTLLS
jgi:dethiobiotin synthetase